MEITSDHLEHGIARLLCDDVESRWTEADGEAALRHQLMAPLLPDLLMVKDIDVRRVEACLQRYTGPLHFGSQLNARSPSFPVLKAIMHFAEQVRTDPLNPLSGNAALILYFGALAAACRCGRRISRKSDSGMAEGFTWARSQRGAQSLQVLFTEALGVLSSPSAPNG